MWVVEKMVDPQLTPGLNEPAWIEVARYGTRDEADHEMARLLENSSAPHRVREV